jgi:hypothetical protein
VSRLVALARLAAEAALIAACLGRPAPEPTALAEAAPRRPAHPRYLGVDPSLVDALPGNASPLFDTETGTITRCTAAGLQEVGALGCSPWRDAEGRYHLVGVERDVRGSGWSLVRCTFPAGRVLDRVAIDVLPRRLPCWFPDGSDRLLLTGTDRRLYVCDLGEAGGTRRPKSEPLRPVQWQVDRPGAGEAWFTDTCWPSEPSLGGRLVVSLHCIQEASGGKWSTHLWWIQLSQDGAAIVEAERVLDGEALDGKSAPVEELVPSVGRAHDGTPVLAFLATARVGEPLELWVMPIAGATAGARHGPRVVGSALSRLAEGCAPVPPTFSADGRWVYAWQLVDYKLRPVRLAVPTATEARPPASPGEPATGGIAEAPGEE